MYEKVEKCPLCNNKDYENFIICRDYTVSQESFAITQCQSCKFLFTNPRPKKKAIQHYYESEDYISHSNKANSLINTLYKVIRSYTLSNKVKIINNLTEHNTILDYGCGTGTFLELAKSNNWKIAGIEPSDRAKSTAINKLGNNIYSTIDKLDDTEQFDIITLWHVLEHVHDLNKTIKQLKSHLKKKGTLIIALPNNSSFDQQLYKQHWAAFDVPRHLYHFNQLTIKTLAHKHYFKIMKIIPMKFDSFYVSLLSEKYKTGKSNYWKSLINGWRSNRWAKNNNNDYSSLIYILKNK